MYYSNPKNVQEGGGGNECADPESRTPISASEKFYIVVIAEIVEIIDIGPGVS